VVVADGVMLVEPLEAVEVKVPGVMATLVAPETDQLSMLLDPEAMLPGFAENDPICGAEPCGGAGMLCEVVEPQPARPAQQNRMQQNRVRAGAQSSGLERVRTRELSLLS